MYIVTVEYIISPAFMLAFLDAILENAETSLHEQPECQQFDVSQSDKNPTHFFLYEVYDSETAFQEHLESKHYKVFVESVKNWVMSKSIKTWHAC